MSLDQPPGYIGKLSEVVGTTEPALRLLLSVFAAYPLAIIHRNFLYGTNKNLQHIYFIISGLALGFFNYGIDIVHTVDAVLFTFVLLKFSGGTEASVAISFIFNMGYLLLGYYFAGTDDYDINWTMPQCVLVLRLIGIVYDIYDGHQPPETLGADNKKVALTEVPNFLEFCGHMFFPASFMVGPQFPMKRYQQFLNGDFEAEDKPNQPPDCVAPAVKRLLLGVLYLAIFQGLGFYVTDNYLLSEEYGNLGFVKKCIILGLWGRYSLYKYISCWLLTEGACILFGLTYNGKDEKGEDLWNGCENVKLSLFESTTEFNHYIRSFNINTNHWVAQYIYKRLKFLGNRFISQAVSLLFLAVWHGFHSGYYICFAWEFIVMYLEKDIKPIFNSNEKISSFLQQKPVAIALHILLRVYTFVFMGWCLLPFVLLTYDRYLKAYAAVYYMGVIIFVPWPFLYGPLLRMLIGQRVKKD